MIASATFAQTSVSPATGSETATPVINPNAGEFQWVEETHDFGTIPQGVPVKNKFMFTNTGKENTLVNLFFPNCHSGYVSKLQSAGAETDPVKQGIYSYG